VRFRSGPVLLALAVLAATAACDAKPASRSGPTPTTQAPAAAGQHDHAAHQGAAAAAGTPAALAGQLQQYLAQDTLLDVRQMRSVLTANAEYRSAADAELAEYTGELAGVVGGAYGDAQGERFRALWEQGTAHLGAYAGALAGNDAEARQQARAGLLADADAYGAWLAAASKGRAGAAEATTVARARVQQLMDQADAYAAHDYDRAYQVERAAYEHSFRAGTALAKAGLPPGRAAVLDQPTEKLRAGLAMLLGEHMQLIIDAQRAVFAGAPEFKAAAAQVNANTAALTKGMGGIVGPAKAREFQSAWAEHVEGLLGYATAVASGDQAAKAAAREEMRGYSSRLALYLSDIVRNELPLGPITSALGQHDQHLVDQVDAYAAKRFGDAQEMELEGYEQMLGVANTLVEAIQRSVQRRLPVGGSQTGGGGTARR
jgi:hypothetical protein